MNGLKGKILEEKHKNLQNRNGVSYMDGSFFDDFGKNSLGRHDALAYFLLNGTSFVAFLANLGNFLNGFTNLKTSAHRQFIETDVLCCQILCKLPRCQVFNTHFSHDVDTLLSQKADLAVPVAGVGVPDNAVIAFADGSVNRGFNHTFFFGYVNRCNSAFDHMLITSFSLIRYMFD